MVRFHLGALWRVMEKYTTIRDELKAYMIGVITLNDFYEWFCVETYNVCEGDDEYELRNHIALLFAEHTNWTNGKRHRTEEDLRLEFAKMLEN
jgi:hypothetical protein